MATIVYQTVNGRKYAYSSESYWNKDKKATRSHRTYLGTVDEETGEIIPSKRLRKQQRAAASQGEDLSRISDLEKRLAEQTESIARLSKELERLQAKCGHQEQILKQVASLTANA